MKRKTNIIQLDAISILIETDPSNTVNLNKSKSTDTHSQSVPEFPDQSFVNAFSGRLAKFEKQISDVESLKKQATSTTWEKEFHKVLIEGIQLNAELEEFLMKQFRRVIKNEEDLSRIVARELNKKTNFNIN